MNMIKHTIITLGLVVATCSFAAAQAYEHCNVNELKDTCKNYLDRPYHYDASNIIMIEMKKKSQIKEAVLPLFSGQIYKLIFNTYALPPGISIDVYDKDQDHEDRKAIFSCNSSDPKKINMYDIDHKHAKQIFVDYTIPASHDAKTDGPPDVAGCGVLVVGYK
jgi:hypothetical protein